MPTYEYRCTDCDHQFETVQSFSDEPLTECPKCGGKLKKVFGNVGIAFKGSGFYVTDSGNKGSKTTAAPAATGSSESSESSSASKSDSSTKSDSSASKGSTDSKSPASSTSSTD